VLRRLSMMLLMVVACVFSMQAQTLNHQTGQSGNAKMTNGMQAVHENTQVVFVKSGATVYLQRPAYAGTQGYSFGAYLRWYDYETDAKADNLTAASPSAQVSNTKGLFAYSKYNNSDVTGAFYGSFTYTAANYNAKTVKKIACDQSVYTDYTVSGSGTSWVMNEPTLSQRMIYEIHPASEMAALVDAATGDNWLEEYTMVAPTGNAIYLGPKYQYKGNYNTTYSSNSFPNYYCTNNGSVVNLSTAITSTASWAWSKGATPGATSLTEGTLTEYQYKKIDAVSSAGTVIYYLRCTYGGKTYNIAKFTVTYYDKSDIGPVASANFEKRVTKDGVKLLESENFNYATGLGTSAVYYSKPLKQDEATYGFYYSALSAQRLTGSNDHDDVPYYQEYCFTNTTSGCAWWRSSSAANFSNHVITGTDSNGKFTTSSDANTGYLLYADGSSKPGTVFSLDFEAELCKGAIMYFSAYMGNVDDITNTEAGLKKAPILDFIITGIDSDGEHAIATYTTGVSTMTGSSWYHIIFPVEYQSEVVYGKYKLKIINRAASVDGNDFVIDDIAVYLQPAPLQPIEASSANKCLTDNSPLVLYTRIDYGQMVENRNGNADVYYRWLDYQGNTITTDKYVGATNSNQNGKITYSKNYLSVAASDTVESFARFDALYHETTTPVVKYVWEENITELPNSNKARYVMYVATPISVTLGNKYTCIIAAQQNDLGTGKTCANSADITVSNGMRINSVAGGGMVKGLRKQICANYSYDLTVVMEYAVLDGNSTHSDRSAYVAHWLFGTAEDVNNDSIANGKDGLYGAGFTEIQKAVENYKTSALTAAQDSLITRLVQKGLLTLCKYNADNTPVATDTTFFVMPLNDEDHLSYTAFPVVKVKSNAPDCTTPQSITLFFPQGSSRPDKNLVTFVKNYGETIPTFVSSRPRRVRIIEGTTETVVKAELSNTDKTYAFKTVSLFSTDDATYTSASAVPTITPTNPFTGTGLSVKFSGLGVLKAGHSYTFKVLYNLANATEADLSTACTDDKSGTLRDGEAYITFLIVPKLLTYTGNGISAAWNDDYNWSLVNGTDTTVTFVPLEETSIIFQSGDHILANPVAISTSVEAKKRLQEEAVEAAALPYITYDINYQPYTCDNVYVPAATALPGQTNIDVKGTWTFEMPVTPNKWVMSSMPVQGIVSGDIFIPASGESTTDVFAVKQMTQTYGTYAADRIDYSFYNSMFNQSVMNVDVNTTYDITSSTWSFATNALTTAFPAGFGWALGFDNAATGKSIRLPKKDNEYHYFRNDAWLGMSETISRDANYGKAAFNGDVTLTLTQNADGNVFLLGNPTFAYIDLLALKNENSNITGVFYLSGLDKGSRYDHVTGQALADNWYTTDGEAPRYLAPMHAVLVVKTGDAAKTLDIKITKSMLVTSNGSKEGNIVKATSAPRRAAALSAEKAIYIKAETERFTSTALLLEDADASDAYSQEEDAEVFLLDRSKTPFAIYTVADNKALAINRISDLDVVPLGFYAQNENESEEVSFTGNDAYLSEWDLVDNTTGNRETLYDGFTTTLSMNEDGVIRYYLEHARKTYGTATGLDEFSTAINAYSHDGQLTVYSADDMTDFCLYDAAGRLLASSANAGRIQQFNLTTGVYVVRASGNVAKVVVK